METSPESTHDLIILEQIEQNPDATQASLAAFLGVAVGTINWHLKRLIAKGYVKVRRAERRKLRYIITTEGLTLRAHLTLDYIQTSFKMYRMVRGQVNGLLEKVRLAGYEAVNLTGDGDVADVCRLTCLEQGIEVSNQADLPRLEVHGWKIHLHFNENLARVNYDES